MLEDEEVVGTFHSGLNISFDGTLENNNHIDRVF
jgi:hypothetical protein